MSYRRSYTKGQQVKDVLLILVAYLPTLAPTVLCVLFPNRGPGINKARVVKSPSSRAPWPAQSRS